MSRIKVASVCPRLALSDPERNFGTLEGWAHRASEAAADIVLFPEVFVHGYAEPFMYERGHADREHFLALAEPIPGPTTVKLEHLARTLGIYVCAGMLERAGPARYNTQVLVSPEHGLLGRYRKVHVGAGEAWFAEPGTEFPVFDVAGVRTGIMICRDKSHPEAARILALHGAELLLAPHATTDVPGRLFTSWSLRICAVRAQENGCYLIADNPVFDCPMEEEHSVAGYSFACDPYGEVIHCDSGDGSTEKMALIGVDTDTVRARRDWEGRGFNLWTRRPAAYGPLVREARQPED